MADASPDPLVAWLAGLLGTISLGWVAATSKKVNRHEVEIAVLREGQLHVKESLNRLETHFGTKPKE